MNTKKNFMPNRRQFLSTLGKTTAGVAFWSTFWCSGGSETVFGAENVGTSGFDPNHLVLLADTHCGPGLKHQLDFFRKTIQEIVAMNPRPTHVLIYGDFAFLYGKKEDYVLLKSLLTPLAEAGIPWTTCMGNHDRRDTFAEVFPEHAEKSLMAERLVFRIETPSVDFLLLDSLIQYKDTSKWITPGEILPDQRDWLHETLKAQTKPIILGAHHLLNETKIEDIILEHSCVVGYINGHAHYWTPNVYKGVQALTLPSCGHWGDIGIVNAFLSPKEAKFQVFMRDYLLGNRGPDFEPNPDREKNIVAKQGAIWRLDL